MLKHQIFDCYQGKVTKIMNPINLSFEIDYKQKKCVCTCAYMSASTHDWSLLIKYDFLWNKTIVKVKVGDNVLHREM